MLGKLQCGVEVASVDAGSEPVVCIVGALDDLFERIELYDALNRSKNLGINGNKVR